MKGAMKDWADWLTLKRSARTVEGYTWEVGRLAAAFPGRSPCDFKATDLTRYLSDRRLTCGAAALKRSVAAFRSFFGWVQGKRSAARGLPWPQVRGRAHRTLSETQVSALLASFDSSSVLGVRDLAMCALLLESGLRAAEVCRLRVSDVDLGALTFRVVVKGGEERAGAFSSNTRDYLARWLAARRAAPGVESVFVSVGGLKPGHSLTTGGLRAVFRHWGKRAEIGALSPHDLRRTFAVLLLRAGCPTRVVQVAGRWAHVAQVETYSRALLAGEALKWSPVARLAGAGGG